jgi:hypothetical protein
VLKTSISAIDYHGSGGIWGIRSGACSVLIDTSFISSFGQDRNGEVLPRLRRRRLYRIDRAAP